MAYVYQYIALNKVGKEIKGVIKADSDKIAKKRLRDDGLIPIDINPVSTHFVNEKNVQNIDKKIKLQDLALFTRELSALLTAGLEIEQSLLSLINQIENKAFKNILSTIHAKILEGYSLSSGLDGFPKAFPMVFRSTVKAAENAGKVGEVLLHLADYIERQLFIRQKIIQALIYPAILTFVGLSIVTFLLSSVVPSILVLFEESDKGLPTLTLILMNISNFLQHYGMYLLLLLIALLLVAFRALRIEKIKASLDTFLLKMPLIGKLIRLIQTERFLRALGILIRSNTPILQSMDVASKLITNIPIRTTVLRAKDRVKEGMSLRLALQQTTYFTHSTLQLIGAGETIGNLGEMIERAANNQQRSVNISLDSFLVLFEPVLILVMGCIVLFIVLAILLPMFQLSALIA